MITGFYVPKAGGMPFYTPSFPRGGMAAVFTFEILQLVGSPTSILLGVEHKNVEDVSWSSAANIPMAIGTGLFQIDIAQLKEEIRIVLIPAATFSWEGVYMLIPAPSWRPY